MMIQIPEKGIQSAQVGSDSYPGPLWPEGMVALRKIAVGAHCSHCGGVGVGMIKRELGGNPTGFHDSSPVSR